jgi:hypothetical protein
VSAKPQSNELDTWTYTADLVLTGRRAQVEVVFADLQRKYGDDLEVVKGPFQHRASLGFAAGLPRVFPRWSPVLHGGSSGVALTSAAAGGIGIRSSSGPYGIIGLSRRYVMSRAWHDSPRRVLHGGHSTLSSRQHDEHNATHPSHRRER